MNRHVFSAIFGLSWLALSGCGDVSSAGYVQDRPIIAGGTYVTVQGLSTQGVDSIVVTAVSNTTNQASTQLLSYAKASGDFSGYLVLSPDSYAVTASAYSGTGDAGVHTVDGGITGGTLVGRGTGAITVSSGATSSLSLDIRDTTTRTGQGDIAPIITSLAASKLRVSPGESVSLTSTAVDLDGDTVTYSWTDDCGGSFASPSAKNTTWSRTITGGCNLKVTARARNLSTSKVTPVVVINQADGTVGIGGRFFSRPEISAVYANATWDGGSSSFDFYRYSDQAVWSLPQSATISLYPNWSAGAGDAGVAVWTMNSTCAGTFALSESTYSSGSWYGHASWSPQNVWLDGGSLACKLTTTVANQQYSELVDQFAIGIELH